MRRTAAVFAAYECIVRPFVEANQALAIKEDGDLVLPRTPKELDARNRMLALSRRANRATRAARRGLPTAP